MRALACLALDRQVRGSAVTEFKPFSDIGDADAFRGWFFAGNLMLLCAWNHAYPGILDIEDEAAAILVGLHAHTATGFERLDAMTHRVLYKRLYGKARYERRPGGTVGVDGPCQPFAKAERLERQVFFYYAKLGGQGHH